jgi:hypothetical protein
VSFTIAHDHSAITDVDDDAALVIRYQGDQGGGVVPRPERG